MQMSGSVSEENTCIMTPAAPDTLNYHYSIMKKISRGQLLRSRWEQSDAREAGGKGKGGDFESHTSDAPPWGHLASGKITE